LQRKLRLQGKKGSEKTKRFCGGGGGKVRLDFVEKVKRPFVSSQEARERRGGRFQRLNRRRVGPMHGWGKREASIKGEEESAG